MSNTKTTAEEKARLDDGPVTVKIERGDATISENMLLKHAAER